MKSFLTAVTRSDKTDLAYELLSFVLEYGPLPSDESVFNLIKGSSDLDDVSHKLNRLFLSCMKETLLNAVSESSRAAFSRQITVEELFDDKNPANDRYRVRFLGYVLYDPNQNALQYFRKYLQQLDKTLYSNGVQLENTVSVCVSFDVIEQIKRVVKDGVLESIVDSPFNTLSKTVLELGLMNSMAKVDTKAQNALDHIWQVLWDYNSELLLIRDFKPDFLILYQSDEPAN